FLPPHFTTPPSPHLYTLSLHDALPICLRQARRDAIDHRRHVVEVSEDLRLRLDLLPGHGDPVRARPALPDHHGRLHPRSEVHLGDRKSTRLNSSHVSISYAVFCLKKKT